MRAKKRSRIFRLIARSLVRRACPASLEGRGRLGRRNQEREEESSISAVLVDARFIVFKFACRAGLSGNSESLRFPAVLPRLLLPCAAKERRRPDACQKVEKSSYAWLENVLQSAHHLAPPPSILQMQIRRQVMTFSKKLQSCASAMKDGGTAGVEVGVGRKAGRQAGT